ncbi:MAG: Ig-like domain-containing protein [Desulfobacteraceae bacterium]
MHKTALPTMIQRAKTLTCLLACLLFLAGCGGGGGSSNADATGGLSFKLQFIDPSDEAHLQISNADADICTAYEISEIRAALSRIDGTELASATWPCEDHGGILDGVAPTTNLVLLIEGFVDGEVAWKGQKGGIEILPGEITSAGTVQMTNVTDDQTAPQILSTTPQDGAKAVPINTVILVQFDEPVSAVSLHGAFSLSDDNSNSVNGVVSYEDNDDEQLWQAKFEPAGNLKPQTQYTITLLTVVHDLAGNHIIDEVQWHFTTGSEALPAMIWGEHNWGEATWQ